jgi:lipoprotein-anchoring transpeptidase ErfK/SrfK
VALTAAQARQASKVFKHPVATLLDIPAPLAYGQYRWDDAGVPPGRIWVRVDLQSQIISVFRGRHEIGTAVVLYGARTNQTPAGTFPILAKLKDHRSAVYDGAPMPYTLRLTGDGVAIHGSNVRDGYATHGCIGVPVEFAAKLFAVASKGDTVEIVDGVAGSDG